MTLILVCGHAEGQLISSDPENILIRSLTQKTNKVASKGKEKAKVGDRGKRVAEDNGNSSAPKRSREEAGPSGSTPAEMAIRRPCSSRLSKLSY